jgi:hypothetical protein
MEEEALIRSLETAIRVSGVSWIVSTCGKLALLDSNLLSPGFHIYSQLSRPGKKLLSYFHFFSSYITARLLVTSGLSVAVIDASIAQHAQSGPSA